MGVIASLTGASAQDFIRPIPLPTGFSRPGQVSSANRIEGESMKGLDFSLGFDAVYDSNAGQDSGGFGDPIRSDFILVPSLSAAYRAGHRRWTFGGDFDLSRDEYLDLSGFSATNYALSGYGSYSSKKLQASFTTGISRDAGINRQNNSFLQLFSFSHSLQARYRLSGNTSVGAAWTGRDSESLTSGFADTSSKTASLYATWKLSRRTELGPGFRWGTRTGANDAKLKVMGPTLKLNYGLSSKLDLRSTVGLDSTDSSSGDDDQLLNWSLALKYHASSRWGLDLSMIQDTQGSLAINGGFDEVTAFRLTHWRRILRSRFESSLGYNRRESAPGLAGVGGANNFDNLEARCALTMPVYRDAMELELSLAYRQLDSEVSDLSWDGWQFGVGIEWEL